MDGARLHGDTAGPAAIVAGARAIRAEIRAGRHQGSTEGLAPGAVQGNVAIFTKEWASDFQRFCYLNPKPCPLIGMTNVGDPMLPMLGDDVDIRTWLPGDVWLDRLIGLPEGFTPGYVEVSAALVSPRTKKAAVRFANAEQFPDRWLFLEGTVVD